MGFRWPAAAGEWASDVQALGAQGCWRARSGARTTVARAESIEPMARGGRYR